LWRIPSGLDMKRLPPEETVRLPTPPEPVTFGMLGRISHEKNHDMFLRALTILKDRGVSVRTVVAGTGPELSRLLQLARQLGVADQITWSGYVAADDFFKTVHVVVMCSRIENLPYVVLEAMSWCRPVVATRVGGIPDLVVDGETGYLVSSGDVPALAERMEVLIRNVNRIGVMGRCGRKRLEGLFSLERTVRQHMELYEKLRERKGKGG